MMVTANPLDQLEETRVAFHAHLDVCEQCREHPFALCPKGAAILEPVVQEDADDHA
jgi:hypothetical protein